MNQFADKPTSGQLERELSQSIQAFYRERLGKRPSRVSCQFFNAKIAITIEDSVTQPVLLLAEERDRELAETVRSELLKAIEPDLRQIIEAVTGAEAIDFLCDSTLDTGRTGIIAVLTHTPDVRNASAIPKSGKSSPSPVRAGDSG
ncbi:MAG: DUF2294 domain-containing protein [Cyanobacteria bacterium J06639_1]